MSSFVRKLINIKKFLTIAKIQQKMYIIFNYVKSERIKRMENKIVYADNAATTALSDEVFQEMLPFLKERFGNPSSLHAIGRDSKAAIEGARKTVAGCIGANPNEIYFTSGGSESDNWAINGATQIMKKLGKNHIITTTFEHHAVLNPIKNLEEQGFSVTYLDVHENGIVLPEEIESAITEKTGLVSIIFANNEIGTIQPIAEIGNICKKYGVIFHTDAVQAAGQIPIDTEEQCIDLLSLSAHKLHGPKGVGALYIRSGIILPNLILGGEQERGRRAGTENVAGIVGLAKALQLSCKSMHERNKRLCNMTDRLIDGLLKIEDSRLNGDRERRLAGNASFCFEGVEGESLLVMLDLKGICVSSGSACTSGSLDPSHVLLALGIPKSIARGSLRFSFSDYNTDDDIDYILETLPPIIERLRKMSPRIK